MNQLVATIYHNPKCSKSRASYDILREQGVHIEEIQYLQATPSKETLSKLCDLMSIMPLDLIRTGESKFKELGLSIEDQKSESEWLDILIAYPILIERPIIQVGDKAVIGRPPEKILTILP